MATTLTAPAPTTVCNQQDYSIACRQKSIDIFDIAIEKNEEVTGWNAAGFALSEMLRGPTEVVIKIAIIVFELLKAVDMVTEYKWSAAAYSLTCAVLLNPIDILASVAATIVRIASSLLGMCSSSLQLQGWRLAEVIHLSSAQLFAFMLRTINPECDLVQESYILPASAKQFFGESHCITLDRIKKPLHELRETETKLIRFVSEFLELVKKENPTYWEPLFKNPKPLPFAEDAKQLYVEIWRKWTGSLVSKEKCTTLSNQSLLAAIKNIDLLIADYFAFGKMNYLSYPNAFNLLP